MIDLDLQLRPLLCADLPDLAAVNPEGVFDVSPATVDLWRQSVRSLLLFTGEVDGSELTPRLLAAWHRDQLLSVSPVTANSRLRALRVMCHRLQRNGVLGHDFTAGVPYADEPRPSPKAVSREDYELMRQHAPSVRDQAIIDVLWATGCRVGELLSMRTDKVEDLGNGRFALYVDGKTGPRWVYVGRAPDLQCGSSLAAWLAERPSHGRWLWLAFTSPPKRMARPTVSSMFRKTRISAGIPTGRPVNPHSFRHAFAIRMLDDGVDLATVSAWLGHSTPEFTAKVYAVRSEQQLRDRYFEG